MEACLVNDGLAARKSEQKMSGTVFNSCVGEAPAV